LGPRRARPERPDAAAPAPGAVAGADAVTSGRSFAANASLPRPQ
jgi:hypothetical protein